MWRLAPWMGECVRCAHGIPEPFSHNHFKNLRLVSAYCPPPLSAEVRKQTATMGVFLCTAARDRALARKWTGWGSSVGFFEGGKTGLEEDLHVTDPTFERKMSSTSVYCNLIHHWRLMGFSNPRMWPTKWTSQYFSIMPITLHSHCTPSIIAPPLKCIQSRKTTFETPNFIYFSTMCVLKDFLNYIFIRFTF